MSHVLTDLKAFLETSPTSWHAVREIGNRFASCDFIPLDEEEKWQLERGKKYFVARGGAIAAFCLPEEKIERILLMAAHTDSPSLKLKPLPCYKRQNMIQLGVETYGAPLLNSWMNRDLKIAGRVVVTNSEGEAEERLVELDDALLFIPQLAIHLDRELNEKGLHLNKQEHLNPIFSLSDEEQAPMEALEKLLRRHLFFNALLSFELFLVPREPARFAGLDNEMLCSYRIDNLASVHAAITALGLVEKPSKHTIQMALFWDNEEIGSDTKEGAGSPLFEDLLSRIAFCLGLNTEEVILTKNHSLCISIDMAHALNPNYPNKSEPHHAPLLGKGIAIKHNANQRYASNAISTAIVVHACKQLNLPYQSFLTRSDLPCGSTIGPIFAKATGINTVDIGAPQLSMHAIREAIAVQDHLDMIRLLTHLAKEG